LLPTFIIFLVNERSLPYNGAGFFFIKDIWMEDFTLGWDRGGNSVVNGVAGILAFPGSPGDGGGGVKEMGDYRGFRAVR
jgi:hypothetical protein